MKIQNIILNWIFAAIIGMLLSILAVAFDLIIVVEVISWQMALVLFPYILFVILMVVYDFRDDNLYKEQ